MVPPWGAYAARATTPRFSSSSPFQRSRPRLRRECFGRIQTHSRISPVTICAAGHSSGHLREDVGISDTPDVALASLVRYSRRGHPGRTSWCAASAVHDSASTATASCGLTRVIVLSAHGADSGRVRYHTRLPTCDAQSGTVIEGPGRTRRPAPRERAPGRVKDALFVSRHTVARPCLGMCGTSVGSGLSRGECSKLSRYLPHSQRYAPSRPSTSSEETAARTVAPNMRRGDSADLGQQPRKRAINPNLHYARAISRAQSSHV
ncbi:hypothetical protein K466DRAFT_122801 [Polyporus arcularius HHB13444]|uniref:Uncharacterized protein n=1 Tax=Polyporus arcularius HHB13444 TaxID=1314778 RepID=A0A5C3PXD4_9APHY|nr:hypothetical protein K466DRAFT_122801 [Polyporus arcularius HHB13444]